MLKRSLFLDNEMIENILQKYKELSFTSEYFVPIVQEVICDFQQKQVPLAFKINDPTILGPVIGSYLKTNNVDAIMSNLWNELNSSQVKELNSKYPKEDILIFIKKAALNYQEKRKTVVPDIIFRPESGLFFKYKDVPYFFLSNFTSHHGKGTRIEEVKYNRAWIAAQGYNIIDIPNDLPFEGSAEVKYVKHGDSCDIIFGYGYRTDAKTISWIVEKMKTILGANFSKINVIKAHIIDEAYYHLDVALKEIPVIENGEIVDETILYYPGAFDEKTKKNLREKYPNAIVLSKQDAESFACNSPTIGKSIIIDNRVSEKLINELKNRGLKVTLIDLSEFFNAGGGGKCLICELDNNLFDFSYENNHKIQMLETTKGVFDIIYINDTYMEGKIGSSNKGLAQKQHENLINCLKAEGAEILFMNTGAFQHKYDFETLRKATYAVLQKHQIATSNIDKFFCQALYQNEVAQSDLIKEIFAKYDELFNSFSEYSWSLLYQCLHDVKKEYNLNNLILDKQIITCPEQLFEIIQKYVDMDGAILADKAVEQYQ